MIVLAKQTKRYTGLLHIWVALTVLVGRKQVVGGERQAMRVTEAGGISHW